MCVVLVVLFVKMESKRRHKKHAKGSVDGLTRKQKTHLTTHSDAHIILHLVSQLGPSG